LFGQTRRKPSREKEDDSDGDSSVCEELIEEPVKEDLTSKEQTTNEDRFVVIRRIRTNAHKRRLQLLYFSLIMVQDRSGS